MLRWDRVISLMIFSNSKHIFKYKTIFKENIDVVDYVELKFFYLLLRKRLVSRPRNVLLMLLFNDNFLLYMIVIYQ